MSFEISLKRKNYRVILVEWRAINSSEGVDFGELLDESVKITLELNCTVPWLESKPISVSEEDSIMNEEHTLCPTCTKTWFGKTPG